MKNDDLPNYLKQGEQARLFPVLSTTSKEGRTTSIVLACINKVEEFGASLLSSVGQRIGKRASIETFTEVVFEKSGSGPADRPDGLIVLRVGSREWRALIEAKVGNADLDIDQIERYRMLAKDNGADCVITISNQFATSPDAHPMEGVRKSRSKIPVFHWSWMHILTTADLLVSAEDIADSDQLVLLNELRRFLSHESAGVKGFERMPNEWSDLNRAVASGAPILAKSPLILPVLQAWHQETRDLSLILSRMTGTIVQERLARKHAGNPVQRQKDESVTLRDAQTLACWMTVPDAAAPLEVTVDIKRKCIDVGMTLRAPEDKKTTKARINWILRQVAKTENENLFLRLLWPGASGATQFPVVELQENPELGLEGKEHLVPHGFHVFVSENLGAKLAQRANFITELERVVPDFYGRIGSNLSAWVKKAPKISADRLKGEDVSIAGIAEDAEGFEG
jgi:hypothetical protein